MFLLHGPSKDPFLKRGKMQITCSWCGKYLGDKEPLSDLSITDSICSECYRKTRDKIEESGEEYGEGFVRGEGQDDKTPE